VNPSKAETAKPIIAPITGRNGSAKQRIIRSSLLLARMMNVVAIELGMVRRQCLPALLARTVNVAIGHSRPSLLCAPMNATGSGKTGA
jgi:hypothetical protein